MWTWNSELETDTTCTPSRKGCRCGWAGSASPPKPASWPTRTATWPSTPSATPSSGLGALALGDIGHLFPDTSDEWKGIDSKILLGKVVAVIQERGFRVGNVDVTIALQRPKLAPHIVSMRETLAPILGVSIDAVSVKATTTERLGFVGRGEGCEVWASAIVIKV